MQAVIIAGGKGTRIKSVESELPKALINIAGLPVIEHQIKLLARYGYDEIIILTGYLAEKIEEYCANGEKWKVKISYFREMQPLGTGGCLKQIENAAAEDFLVINGDQVMDFDISRMYEFHKKNNAVGTLFLHPNDHPFDSDLVEINSDKFVTNIHTKPHSKEEFYKNLVNAGVYILNKKIFDYIRPEEKQDIVKDVIKNAWQNREKIAGYVSPEYIKDMGTPERFKQVEKDILSGKVARLNLANKRPAVFIDRDGVLNKEVNFLSKLEELELLPGAAEAVSKINKAGYLAVVVTNQPVIARNMLDYEGLEKIHNKLEWLLGKHHAYLDAIYFCPHHPDSGYPEERKELKVDCECRKPKPGMIFQAEKDLNIDLQKSFIVGDRESDIKAGQAAGIKTILVKTNVEGETNENIKADFYANSLRGAVDFI